MKIKVDYLDTDNFNGIVGKPLEIPENAKKPGPEKQVEDVIEALIMTGRSADVKHIHELAHLAPELQSEISRMAITRGILGTKVDPHGLAKVYIYFAIGILLGLFKYDEDLEQMISINPEGNVSQFLYKGKVYDISDLLGRLFPTAHDFAHMIVDEDAKAVIKESKTDEVGEVSLITLSVLRKMGLSAISEIDGK